MSAPVARAREILEPRILSLLDPEADTLEALLRIAEAAEKTRYITSCAAGGDCVWTDDVDKMCGHCARLEQLAQALAGLAAAVGGEA